MCYGCTGAVKEAKAAAAVKALAERKLAAEEAGIVKPPENKEEPPQGHGEATGPGAKTPAPTTDRGGGGSPLGKNRRSLGHGGATGPGAKTPASPTGRGGGGSPWLVKSSQGLLFSEARKPCAEAAGHGRRGWCARVWPPPPPGLSKEPGERLVIFWLCCADQAIFVRFRNGQSILINI